MKVATKKLIIKTLNESIRSYEASIEHCKTRKLGAMVVGNDLHIAKLEKKAQDLKNAIEEISY